MTQKNTPFHFSPQCKEAFSSLKLHLTSAPILTYPCFGREAAPFTLYTDASAAGVGAVLEQGGHVIAYTSRSMTQPERQYSVECLAIVYAVKQFRHYLLGRKFKLVTPLQWLREAQQADEESFSQKQHTLVLREIVNGFNILCEDMPTYGVSLKYMMVSSVDTTLLIPY